MTALNTIKLKQQVLALVGSNSIHTLRYLQAIAPYFKQVVFITNGQWQNTSHLDNVIDYKINFQLSSFNTPKKIANILIKHQIELVHIQQANSYAFHTLKAIKKHKLKCKTILTTWGSDVLILPNENILFKKLVRFNLDNADIITSDSLFMSNQINKLSKNIKELHTINFGIQQFPTKLDITQKQNIILSNRLHKPLYNIDNIILGFANFIKNPKYSHYKLIVAATGSETNNLIDLVSNLNIEQSVEFTGMISYDELIKYYKIAKVFISIPDSDATSLSVLEAMGYGCYPILSNIPANLEWVIDEINGTICQNSDNLSQDIIDGLNSKLDEITAFNYQLIAKKAVFNNNLQKFLKLY